MAKTKTAYFCQSCGYESAKWLGKCPSCNQWNTFVEEIIEKGNAAIPNWKTENTTSRKISKPNLINEIQSSIEKRYSTGDKELDRVLGGGR